MGDLRPHKVQNANSRVRFIVCESDIYQNVDRLAIYLKPAGLFPGIRPLARFVRELIIKLFKSVEINNKNATLPYFL